MNLPEWLEEEKGRSAALANHFGKSAGAISQWKTNGVPLNLMKQVRDFTGGAVTLDEMVPGPSAPVEPLPAAEIDRRRSDRREPSKLGES